MHNQAAGYVEIPLHVYGNGSKNMVKAKFLLLMLIYQ